MVHLILLVQEANKIHNYNSPWFNELEGFLVPQDSRKAIRFLVFEKIYMYTLPKKVSVLLSGIFREHHPNMAILCMSHFPWDGDRIFLVSLDVCMRCIVTVRLNEAATARKPKEKHAEKSEFDLQELKQLQLPERYQKVSWIQSEKKTVRK